MQNIVTEAEMLRRSREAEAWAGSWASRKAAHLYILRVQTARRVARRRKTALVVGLAHLAAVAAIAYLLI
jgi:hypothetical protein